MNTKQYLWENYTNYDGLRLIDEFKEDYQLFSTIKRMLTSDTSNYRLLMNNFIRLHNAFGQHAIRVIPFEFADYLPRINAMLTYMGMEGLPHDKPFLKTLRKEIER